MLETQRLLLRAWRDEDLEPWYRMNADPRVMEFFPGTWDRERADGVATRIRAMLDAQGYGWWVVEVKNRAPFAGVIQLQDVPFTEHFTPATEVGWRFACEYWGNGYATEGAAAALDFGFATLGLREIVAMTAVSNLRSRRVMERLGMQRDVNGDFDHPRIEPGHPLRRHVLYRKTASDARTA